MKIKTPATSANVGVGFDSFGMALGLYNTFTIEQSDQDILEHVEERFNHENNLFLKAYHYGCDAIGVKDYIKVSFDTNIPVSRGLGSSASLICAGLYSASVLHHDALSKEEIFQLASIMEGHPDNVAPCIFGGMTVSSKVQDTFITKKIDISSSWKYTLFIPDFEVSTEKARGILPEHYSLSAASGNIANAIYMIKGLEEGDISLLQYGELDQIHEPYRKKLLPFFDELRKEFKKETGGILLISGSGSTCIGMSQKEVSDDFMKKISYCDILKVDLCEKGMEIDYEE